MAVDYPITRGVRFLREKKIDFEPFLYLYQEHGGTAHAARQLHVPEHSVIKSLVMEAGPRKPLMVLMHGDLEVSQKELARVLGVKQVTPCTADDVMRLTGYLVGGVSPFGTRMLLPLFVERTIFDLARIFINGGKRGFLVALDPDDLRTAFNLTEVNVAIAPSR